MKAYNQTENEYRPTGNYGLLIKQKESRKSHSFVCYQVKRTLEFC
jgi:hypothetical protein